MKTKMKIENLKFWAVMTEELKPKRIGKYHHNGNVKHGLYKEHKELFNLWQTMKSRCENPNFAVKRWIGVMSDAR